MLIRTITHVIVGLTALSIPLALFDGSLFSWHPSFMAVGFLGLMSEGILTSISFRNLEGTNRLDKIWTHLFWQATAVLCIVAGFATIYQNKVNNGKPHFQTVHGKFGVTTFTFALLAAAGGLVSFRRLGLLTKLPEQLQIQTKWLHRNSGLIVWLLSLVTIELALTHPAVWKDYGWLSHVWQAAVIFLGAALLYIWTCTAGLKGNYEPSADHELI